MLGEADLLCQLAAGRYFRRLTVPDGAAGEVPNAAGAIRDAVIVASNRHQPVVADAPLELKQRIERHCRQRLQLGPFSGKRIGNDFLRCAVNARIGIRC